MFYGMVYISLQFETTNQLLLAYLQTATAIKNEALKVMRNHISVKNVGSFQLYLQHLWRKNRLNIVTQTATHT